jgi:HPt (histidine-containing phosphotransfer) domain-containing protein
MGHFARMTLGDASLEREILQLFDRQTSMLLARMRQTTPAIAAACAHTLKGSSRGIGAWRVASAAEAVELAAAAGNAADMMAAIDRIGSAIDEASAAIAELLRAH